MAGSVRQPIDTAKLEAYLRQAVPEIELPLEVKQFGFGQSNPTYQLTSPDGRRYVLRKKPPGVLVSQTAHKVEREYRILAALAAGAADVPVPRPLCLCEDVAVVGTPFYLMAFLDGRILTDPVMPALPSPAVRRAMWSDAVRVLARLHRVDPRQVGLETYGRPTGFYARQIATWSAICSAQAAARDLDTDRPVGQLPFFDHIVAFFADKRFQPTDRSSLIHGDYKIDNLVFHPTQPKVIGILDWEMSTRGHPLSDLLNLMTPYYTAHMTGASHTVYAGFLPGATPGLPSLDEVTALYAAEAGWSPSPSDLRWAAAFNIFRQAAICQGIAARVAARQASSAVAHSYAASREPLACLAWDLVGKARELHGSDGKARL
ncbi:phosphotransferase enzyme family protein [Grosmannia clavigera kw1407]|uniref:Phosphotransferase enzyme family protein n=1 Tax=Grosmannia clavigera (strain kw1407 / UAMH 11150) TaxID=655863 RepID=F0XE15_GROCL|nr:phosphotransferase enzyme family protein [Grosmannia clavigera kw1407]EFX04126.1 phosphotransferase enzyme family protein [Grosmannia clavigera kw1407]